MPSKQYERITAHIENLKKTHTFHAPASTPGVVSWCPKRITKEQQELGITKK